MEPQPSTHPAELVVYFGSAIVLAFGALAVAMSWDHLSAPVQVLVLVAAAAILGVASWLTPTATLAGGRISDVSGSTAAVVLGWASGLAAHRVGLSNELAVSLGAFVGAGGGVVAYLRRNGVVPMVVVGSGALMGVLAALADLGVDDLASLVVGTVLGLAWWGLGAAGVVQPTRGVMVAGGVHVFAIGVLFLDLGSPWPLLTTMVAVAAFAVAAMWGVDPRVNRGLAVAVGLLGIAQLGALIEDVVLRFVIGGIAIGVAVVVVGISMVRRDDSLGSPPEAADTSGS